MEVLTDQPIQERSNVQESLQTLRRLMGRGVLILTMAMSSLAALAPREASAQDGGYPDARKVCVVNGKEDGTENGWCPGYQWGDYIRDSNGNIIGNNQTSSRGYDYRNCTDWVAWRIPQLTGVAVPKGLGNATTWDDRIRAPYVSDNTPEAGDIAVWDSTYPGDQFGHVAVVESVNTDGSVNISEYNYGKNDGDYGTRNSIRANHYIDLNGSGVGANGNAVSTGPVGVGSAGERSVVKSSEGHYYLKHGGVFWHIGYGLSKEAIGQWGSFAGTVEAGQLHDFEVNYTDQGYTPGAHAPMDGTVVQEQGSSQLYEFIAGEAFPLGSMAEVDALGLRNRIGTIPAGKLVSQFFEAPNLPNGFLFKEYGGTTIRFMNRNVAAWVNSETKLACAELRVGGTNLVPASFENRLADAGRVSSATIGCEFPANWALALPGRTQRWRVTGDGKTTPYVRYDYPNMLGVACGTNGQPVYEELRSPNSLANTTFGGTLYCPDNTFLRSEYGNIYQYKGGSLHKVLSMNTLNCLGGPHVIQTTEGYLSGIAVGGNLGCELEGKVVKEPTGKVWYIRDDERHYVGSAAVMNGILGRVASTGNRLVNVSAQQVSTYETGSTAYVPYGPPIFGKYADNPRIWLILPDGTKRHALSLCSSATVRTFPDGEFDGHQITESWSANEADCRKIAAGEDLG